MTVGPPDVVEALDCFVGRLDQHVEVLHLVQDSERTALLAGAVVGQDHQQRVVELADALEVRHQATDLGVGVSRYAAKASWSRDARSLWFTGSESQGSTPGLRGASLVSGGSRPISIWLANHRSRAASQPSSKRPLYFSRYSAGAWSGRAWLRRPGR